LVKDAWRSATVTGRDQHRQLSVLRRTPRHGADGNRYIVTIPHRGYQLGTLIALRRPFIDTFQAPERIRFFR
jgi:DNA-binding winged helix-turn-helix (wHTH) protein